MCISSVASVRICRSVAQCSRWDESAYAHEISNNSAVLVDIGCLKHVPVLRSGTSTFVVSQDDGGALLLHSFCLLKSFSFHLALFLELCDAYP